MIPTIGLAAQSDVESLDSDLDEIAVPEDSLRARAARGEMLKATELASILQIQVRTATEIEIGCFNFGPRVKRWSAKQILDWLDGSGTTI